MAAGAAHRDTVPAIYCVYDRDAEEPVYVGETAALPARAASHATALWSLRESWPAYLSLPEGTPKHILRELESDLLGWHFWRAGQAPILQYADSLRKPSGAVAP